MQRHWACLWGRLLLLLALSTAVVGAEEQVPEALPAGDLLEGSPTIALGEKVKLDHLGPAIVTEDGTLKRITNWEQMTDAEKTTAKRRIAERNKERVEAIRQRAMHSKAAHKAGFSDGNNHKEQAVDAVDAEFQDVVDFKAMPVQERTKFLDTMGDGGRKAFATRVAAYHKAKTAQLTPQEREERSKKGREVLDAASPQLREKLVKLLSDAKRGRGGSRADVKRVLSETAERKAQRIAEVLEERQRRAQEVASRASGKGGAATLQAEAPARAEDDDDNDDDEYLLELDEEWPWQEAEAPGTEHDEL